MGCQISSRPVRTGQSLVKEKNKEEGISGSCKGTNGVKVVVDFQEKAMFFGKKVADTIE